MAIDVVQKSNNINKEIYILSDLQQSAFGRDSSKLGNENIKLIAFPLAPKSVNNTLIENINIVSTIIEKGKLVELQGTFVNTGDVSTGNKLAQLFVNDEKTAQTTINLLPKTSTTESFKFVLNKLNNNGNKDICMDLFFIVCFLFSFIVVIFLFCCCCCCCCF